MSSVGVPVKAKCAEPNRHDATTNSVPQQEHVNLCLWGVLEKKKDQFEAGAEGPLLAGLRGNKELKQTLPSALFPGTRICVIGSP
jgi:hypothetical protein